MYSRGFMILAALGNKPKNDHRRCNALHALQTSFHIVDMVSRKIEILDPYSLLV
jgi:hypothetical protein